MNFATLVKLVRKRHLTGMYLEAFVELSLCKALTVFVPFGRWAHRQGRYQSETLREDRKEDLPRILPLRGALLRLARRVPWKSKCLDQALAMQRMLGRRGLATTTYFGMIRDKTGKWTAHAWVRCGNIWAIGYQTDREYTVVGTYARIPRLRSGNNRSFAMPETL
jgi:hypothetical protein